VGGGVLVLLRGTKPCTDISNGSGAAAKKSRIIDHVAGAVPCILPLAVWACLAYLVWNLVRLPRDCFFPFYFGGVLPQLELAKTDFFAYCRKDLFGYADHDADWRTVVSRESAKKRCVPLDNLVLGEWIFVLLMYITAVFV